MKLNTTSKYAIRILTLISKNDTDKYNAKMLSEILEIPYKYLTKLMTSLTKAGGLITSQRGREGGYVLTKDSNDIFISDILEAVNESLEKKECLLGAGLCTGSNKCGLHDEWQEPKNLLLKMFEEKKL